MKTKKAAHWLIRIILLVFLADAVFVLVFPRTSLPQTGEKADAVVVLGAAPNSPAIHNRALKGYQLYNEGRARQLVLSGGVTSNLDESEAQNMNRFLQKQGLPVQAVLEQKSTNTLENLENSRRLLPEAGSVIVVSDVYHLPRAFLVAKAVGFARVYWDAPSSNYYKASELMWYYGREVVAILAYIPKLLFIHFSGK